MPKKDKLTPAQDAAFKAFLAQAQAFGLNVAEVKAVLRQCCDPRPGDTAITSGKNG